MKLTPGIFGLQVCERAADLVRHVLLRVPHVEVAWPALQVDHDDTLGLAPTGAAFGDARFDGLGLEAEQRAESASEDG